MTSVVIHFDSSQFPNFADFTAHISNYIKKGGNNTLLVYGKIPEDWSTRVWSLVEEEFERRYIRKTLNTKAKTLSLKVMPNDIHDSCQDWQGISLLKWCRDGLLSADEATGLFRVRATLHFKDGSRTEPDLFVRPSGLALPTLVMENYWSESSADLENDLNLLIAGGAGSIRAVFVLKWCKHSDNQIGGSVHVYVLDVNGMPVLLGYPMTIYPRPQDGHTQMIRITRGQLFWGVTLPQNRSPDDLFEYRLDDLRACADYILDRMGLYPAQ